MKTNEKKKLLVLGGGEAAVNVVREAKKQGLYVIATDYLPGGRAKEEADKSYQISTCDIEKLKQLVAEEEIDGVFCGPSEFNIVNTMTLCEETGLPFYATREQWNICSNKMTFKKLCREHGVPCVEEYDIKKIDETKFPVIVKPVDGHSSRGIKVCNTEAEVHEAYENALEYSESGQAIIERYIDSEGVGFNVRYIAQDKKLHLVLTGDTYIVDPYERTALINAVGIYPSKYNQYYMENINKKVKKMFESIGIDHSSLFIQALVDNDKLYFHEMGLRLSGGLLYKLVEPITDINDMKMLIRYAVGEKFAFDDEISQIDSDLKGKKACIFNIPLKPGKIGKICGCEKIKETINLQAFEQYYWEGDTIEEGYIGTIQQHLGRFKFIADTLEEIMEIIDFIQRTIIIRDTEGNDMIYQYFDTARISV